MNPPFYLFYYIIDVKKEIFGGKFRDELRYKDTDLVCCTYSFDLDKYTNSSVLYCVKGNLSLFTFLSAYLAK